MIFCVMENCIPHDTLLGVIRKLFMHCIHLVVTSGMNMRHLVVPGVIKKRFCTYSENW